MEKTNEAEKIQPEAAFAGYISVRVCVFGGGGGGVLGGGRG